MRHTTAAAATGGVVQWKTEGGRCAACSAEAHSEGTARLTHQRQSAPAAAHAEGLGAAAAVAAAAALLPGAAALVIKPATANTFGNQSVTFTSDMPVRWRVVPHQGMPSWVLVSESLYQITVRAGRTGAPPGGRPPPA